jgi:hypothetical protein
MEISIKQEGFLQWGESEGVQPPIRALCCSLVA